MVRKPPLIPMLVPSTPGPGAIYILYLRYRSQDGVDGLRDDGVAEASKAVHPMGNP